MELIDDDMLLCLPLLFRKMEVPLETVTQSHTTFLIEISLQESDSQFRTSRECKIHQTVSFIINKANCDWWAPKLAGLGALTLPLVAS